jgi:hypothetical protein
MISWRQLINRRHDKQEGNIMMQKWEVEVIRYDGKGKKVVEIDYVDAEAYRMDDHNNLIFQYIPRIDIPLEHGQVIKIYHAYNWISIKPYTEE